MNKGLRPNNPAILRTLRSDLPNVKHHVKHHAASDWREIPDFVSQVVAHRALQVQSERGNATPAKHDLLLLIILSGGRVS
jgi:hypothetical protein